MSESKDLTRSDIVNQKMAPPERVYVPEWGGSVYVKRLTVKERDAYENSLFDKKGRPSMKGARARLVMWATTNKDGLKMFGGGDDKALDNLDAAGVDRIAKRAMELSGMTDSDIEDAAEGFGLALGDDSSSE